MSARRLVKPGEAVVRTLPDVAPYVERRMREAKVTGEARCMYFKGRLMRIKFVLTEEADSLPVESG